jgi:hypothetical protein
MIGGILNLALNPLGFELRRKASKTHAPRMLNLPDNHLSKCRVLSSRVDLISLLPRHGVVAEIGVKKGKLAAEILRVAQPTTLHLVDKAPDQIGARFDSEISAGRVILHGGMSTEVLAALPEGLFDWVYLDTSHTYEDTRRELDECARVVKGTGYIAGHDFCFPYGVIAAVYDFCVKSQWALKS